MRLLIFAFLCVILISCKKYDEGPFVSFRGKEKRLVGNWLPENPVEFAGGLGNEVFEFRIMKDNEVLLVMRDSIATDTQFVEGSWSWINKKKEVVLTLDTVNLRRGFLPKVQDTMVVTRLRYQGLKFKSWFIGDMLYNRKE